MAERRYNRGSVERALELHYRKPIHQMRNRDGSYTVSTRIGLTRLRTLREAYLHVVGLAEGRRIEAARSRGDPMRVTVIGDDTAAVFAIDDLTGETSLVHSDYDSEELKFWTRVANEAAVGPVPALNASQVLIDWAEDDGWGWERTEMADYPDPPPGCPS